MIKVLSLITCILFALSASGQLSNKAIIDNKAKEMFQLYENKLPDDHGSDSEMGEYWIYKRTLLVLRIDNDFDGNTDLIIFKENESKVDKEALIESIQNNTAVMDYNVIHNGDVINYVWNGNFYHFIVRSEPVYSTKSSTLKVVDYIHSMFIATERIYKEEFK